MAYFLISGLINIETTVQVDGFPIYYTPVRYPFFGVNSSVSGVGYNVARALTTLGDSVSLLSMIGRDLAGKLVEADLEEAGIEKECILASLAQTPQSVILYQNGGERMIHVDLKDIQDTVYPAEIFDRALESCSTAILCNINFSRPFLEKARRAGKRIATDVHAISDLDDPYNRDFMAAADILFMSDERLPVSPEEWAQLVMGRYGAEVVVIGLGARGALLAHRETRAVVRLPAVRTRPVINTIGAGDALFSGFSHFYEKGASAYDALRKAMVFASYKIGAQGASDGFLDEASLLEESGKHYLNIKER